jgi:hypothetical protein
MNRTAAHAARAAASGVYVEYELTPGGWRSTLRRAEPMRSSRAAALAARERARTAFHEAAHGVVARAIGLAVEKISINEQDGRGGVCRVIWPNERRQPVKSMFFQLAAFSAQVLTYSAVEGCETDLSRAEESATAFIGARDYDPTGLMARCSWYGVERLVAEHMEEIKATARALLDGGGELEGFDELAVLGPVPKGEERLVTSTQIFLHAAVEGPKHQLWRENGAKELQTLARAAGMPVGEPEATEG